MEVEISKFDHFGRGIGKINEKIVFVSRALPGEIVDILVTKNKKNYLEGKINKIIKPSINRIESLCPFYNKCGGCNFLHTTYDIDSENLEQNEPSDELVDNRKITKIDNKVKKPSTHKHIKKEGETYEEEEEPSDERIIKRQAKKPKKKKAINSKGEEVVLKEYIDSSEDIDKKTGKVKPHKKKYINDKGVVFEEQPEDETTRKRRAKEKAL